MYDSETSLTAFIESEDKLLNLEGSEVLVEHSEGQIQIEVTEYRLGKNKQNRRGESLEIILTEEQVARTAQIISDWLSSRTKGSFDKYIGVVSGKMWLFRNEDLEQYSVEELRIALDERGIFLIPGTGNDYPTPIRIPENTKGTFDNVHYFKDFLLDVLELSTSPDKGELQQKTTHRFEYDVFICHSSADKKKIVEPLADDLDQRGLQVWYDDFEISLGDDIRDAIEEGIANSRYGVIVLSDQFLEADWAGAELSSLTAREHSEGVQKILLPLRYGIGMDSIRENTPLLASKYTMEITEDNIGEIAKEICEVIRRD